VLKTRGRVVAALAVAFACCGCSATVAGSGSAAPTTGSSPSPPSSSISEGNQAAPAPTSSALPVQGDVATNRTCKLASVSEVEGLTSAPVVGLKGLTNPATPDYSCVWFLKADIMASLLVAWDPSVKGAAGFVKYYRELIREKTVVEVPNLGSVAYIQGHTAELWSGATRLTVNLLLHAEATAADRETAERALRFFYERVNRK
jgi:hypothetical protein